MEISFFKIVVIILFLLSVRTITSAKPGDLDSSFGENGILIHNYDNAHFPIDRVGMLILDNQDILAGYNIKEQGYLVKFDKYGNLDKTFGKQGELALKFKNTPIKFDWISKDNSNNIFILSNFNHVYKLNNNFEFDSSFAEDGEFDDLNIFVFEFTSDKSGRILLPSLVGRDTCLSFYLIRLNVKGQLDSIFGDDGIASIDFGLDDRIWGFAEQNDGKLLLFGQTCIINEDDSQKSISNIALCRLFNSGVIDSSFGEYGRVITDLPGKWSVSCDCKIQKDGKILLSCTDGLIDKQNTKIIRYLENGTIDSSFGKDGVATLKAGIAFLTRGNLLIQDDQKVICGGLGTIYSDREFIFAQRFYDNGVLDSTFGLNGRVEFIVDNGDDLVKNNGNIYSELVDNNILWYGKMINYDYRISGLLMAKIKTDQLVNVIESMGGDPRGIGISPNPAEDYIDILLDNVILSEAKDLKIYNSLGQCILSPAGGGVCEADGGGTTISFGERQGGRLDISALPTGIYYLVINDGKEILTNGFVVLR